MSDKIKVDYEAEVKKVYPDAKLNGDMESEDCSLYWWIESMDDTISDYTDYEADAWKSAYDILIEERTK